MAPKVQVPSDKPFPSTPVAAVPAPIPQFKFAAPIKLNVNTSAIISWVLSEKFYHSVKELLVLAPEVRRNFKETMTMKRLPALPVEAQTTAAHMVSTYSMMSGTSSELTLPLWTLEVTLDNIITVMGIIDSG